MKKFYVMFNGMCVAIFRTMEEVGKFMEHDERHLYIETRYEERRPVRPF